MEAQSMKTAFNIRYASTQENVWQVFVACLLMTAHLGCTPNTARTFPVVGEVTFNGMPCVNATVYFEPIIADGSAPKPAAARGVTNELGKYFLTTFRQDDGAVPGEYRVLVRPYIAAIPDTGPAPQQHLPIPARYSDPATTPLNVKVAAESNTIDLRLEPQH